MPDQKKKPFVAFTLSFFLPGAGLAYLGKWKWAIINFLVVLLVGVAAAFLLPEDRVDEYMQYLAIGCAGGSAGIAHAMAKMMNEKSKTDDAA